MPLTVRDLLRIPHLQLSVHAGADGLNRAVTWAHASDLPNPWEWLGAGELLLTNGLGLAADGPGQADYLDHLAEAGTSALVVGTGMPGPPLTGAFTDLADRLPLAVLAVPYNVPFTAVARAVADANAREESRRVAQVARIYDRLRASVADQRPAAAVFDLLGRDLGCRLYLMDPETGLSLFDDGPQTSFAGALLASFREHGGAIPGILRLRGDGGPDVGGSDPAAAAVAIPGEQPAVLVAEPVDGRLPSLDLLQHVATAGALGLAQVVAGRERRCRLDAELLARLLDRRIDPATARRQFADAGLDPTGCVLAVHRAAAVPSGPAGPAGPAEPVGPAGPAEPAGPDGADCLHHRLARRRVPHLVLARDGLVHVVVADRADHLDLVQAPGATGLSEPIAVAARLPDAGQEARWALGVAEAEGRGVVRYGEQTALLLPRTPVEARALVARVLGGLIAYDAEHGTDYLGTLRVMLRRNRSWRLAAQDLHIHKQTLGYRLRKIEQLTGRGLAETEHLAELWFALRAHDLLA